MRIPLRIQLFISKLIRFWIQGAKPMQIHADQDPDPGPGHPGKIGRFVDKFLLVLVRKKVTGPCQSKFPDYG
jgi:hypothetical protein